MTCDDVILSLDGGPVPAVVEQHLRTCAACRDAALVVGLAVLPEVDAETRAELDSLPAAVSAAWAARPAAPKPTWQRWAQLALAAGLGAVVASAALLSRPVQTERVEVPKYVLVGDVDAPVVPDLSSTANDEPNLSDDDVFFEVGWPSTTSNEE